MEEASKLEQCQHFLNISFKNPKLLEESLTHSSAYKNGVCNERMEFLGDSILGMVVTEYIFLRFPDFDEGKLTKIKSVVVSRATLAGLTHKLGLARFCTFGQGTLDLERLPTSILANLYEAIVAAIYLDQGYEAAKNFILPHLHKIIGEQDGHDSSWEDHKSLLQHHCQKFYGFTPVYKILETDGPEHEKQFLVGAYVSGRILGQGRGGRKKEAEQMAAKHSLEILQQSTLTREDFQPSSRKKPKDSILQKIFGFFKKR